MALLRNLVVLKTLQWSLVRYQTAVALKSSASATKTHFKCKQCGDLKQAALQVDPESVARPVPSDLRMHSLNAHCIFKLYNISIYMGFQQKDLNLDPA